MKYVITAVFIVGMVGCGLGTTASDPINRCISYGHPIDKCIELARAINRCTYPGVSLEQSN